jgi:Serine protease inhibitor
MKRKIAVLAAVVLAAALLTGCIEEFRSDDKLIASMETVTAAPLVAPVYGERDAAAEAVAQGANAFAFRLSAALAAEQAEENFLCSPYSVWMPLAALVNATDKANKPTLLEVLGAAGISAEDVNRAASRMLYDLTNLRGKEYVGEDYYNPLRIANLLLVSEKWQANKDFVQIFADAYRGGVMRADFSSKEAVDVVNLWASEHTEGLIDNVLQELDPYAIALLANAIYFSDRWSWEFDEESTKTDVFHAPNGDAEANFMLREGDQLPYFEDERAQAMPLSFKTGGAMYIILPKDGDTLGLMSALGEGYFSEICNGINGRTGKLLLPRFSMESDLKLADALTALGVPLFDAATAPLTGLVEGEAAFLSSAVQKAVIEVNEKGTTAAAVTVMTAAGAGMPTPTESFEMNCNRPFVFVLCGNTYDGGSQVLFTGIVNRP